MNGFPSDKPLSEPMMVSLLTHKTYALPGLNELTEWAFVVG